MRVQDVLRTKQTQSVVTVSPQADVATLVDLLAVHDIGAVVVSNDGVRVLGVVSERDVVRRIARGESVLGELVAVIMTTDVHTAAPHDTVDDLMQVMTTHRVRHVPIVQDDHLVGLVSIGDVVKHRIGQLEFERDQLQTYMHS